MHATVSLHASSIWHWFGGLVFVWSISTAEWKHVQVIEVQPVGNAIFNFEKLRHIQDLSMPVFNEKLRYIPHCESSVVNSADFGKYLRMKENMSANLHYQHVRVRATFEPLYAHLVASYRIRNYLFCMLGVGPCAGSHSLWKCLNTLQSSQLMFFGTEFLSLTRVLEAFGQVDCLV